jgi:hypothetical protein
MSYDYHHTSSNVALYKRVLDKINGKKTYKPRKSYPCISPPPSPFSSSAAPPKMLMQSSWMVLAMVLFSYTPLTSSTSSPCDMTMAFIFTPPSALQLSSGSLLGSSCAFPKNRFQVGTRIIGKIRRPQLRAGLGGVSMAVKQDYYKILGVEKNADMKDIKRAYKRLAMRNHPDINKDPDAKV